MGYELIETIEVGSGGAASIEFTSIPQTGVDLLLKVSARDDKIATSSGGPLLKLNGVVTNNFSWVRLFGTGTSATTTADSGDSGINGLVVGDSATANTFANIEYRIANFTTTGVKTISGDMVNEDNAAAVRLTLVAGATTGTAGSVTDAVTSIKLSLSDNFVQYTTASLYIIS